MRSIIAVALILMGFLFCRVAAAQQSYPNGTVFTESFGNNSTNPVTCPDGSTDACVNTWVVDQGSSDVSIVSSPCTGGSGNAMELAAASTVPEVETYGSFPAIPTSANWTITLKVCIAASVSGFQNLIILKYESGGSLDIGINATGTSFESTPGYTTCAGAGTGALNTLVLSKASGIVTWTVNGTQCGSTFSDSGNLIGDVFLAGMTTSGANVFVQSVQITGAGSLNGSFPPSFFIDFNGQAGNTVSTSTLQAGVECNANAQNSGTTLGDWNIPTLTGVSFSFPASSQKFASNLSACGGSFSGNTSSSLEMAVTTTTDSGGEVEDGFNTTYTTVSVGGYVEISGSGAIGSNIGLDFIELGGPSEYNLQWQDGSVGGTYKMCFENDNGGGTASCSGNVSNNTFYWVTFDLTGSGGTNHAWIYTVNSNGSVGTLVSELTESGTHEPMAAGPLTLLLGKTGSETMTNSEDVYYSNVIVDLAAANAPLLPPAGSAINHHALIF